MRHGTPGGLAAVLSGGGARGAYEAGVLRYVAEHIASQLPDQDPVDAWCGTSAGALNAAWFAGHGLTPRAARGLSELWREMSINDIYRFDAKTFFTTPLKVFRSKEVGLDRSALDGEGVRQLVHANFPYEGIRDRIAAGELQALVITATEVATGRSVHFLQSADQVEQVPERLLGAEAIRASRLTPDHCLASAAIPFIFPAVQLAGHWYVDGSLRQNTPLRPALYLGAERILVIAVKRSFSVRAEKALSRLEQQQANLVFLAGKTLNALMLDPIEQDLYRVEGMNRLFEWGERTYGPEFMARLNDELGRGRPMPYRRVRTLLFRPREDLGQVAAQAMRRAPPAANRATRVLLGAVSDQDSEDADLLSYLLFDGGYTGELERLGWEDARERADELYAFLDEELDAAG